MATSGWWPDRAADPDCGVKDVTDSMWQAVEAGRSRYVSYNVASLEVARWMFDVAVI